MQIKRTHIECATDESRDPWAVSDGLLYDLCATYPEHRDAKGVTAKMLLIGRAYAAAAERGRSAGSAAASLNDDFYTCDLPQALRNSQLDGILDGIRPIQRINEENAAEILQAHTALMDVLRVLTGINKRSLASKYLHFHLPNLFFILDLRAKGVMRLLSPRSHGRTMISSFGGDPEYSAFVRAALSLRQALENEFGVQLTPRHLDRILLAVDATHRKTMGRR
jgi:hypothetical protein